MIKRIWKYDKNDWKHIGWLFRNMLKQFFFEANPKEAKEAWYWILMHLSNDSERKENEEKKK